jgi:hypothetical protein
MGVEKLRDLDVVPVFFALQIVFNQDQLLGCFVRSQNTAGGIHRDIDI